MPRWRQLCQQCWEALHEGEYLPEKSVDLDHCEDCSEFALLYASARGHHDGPQLKDVGGILADGQEYLV